MSDTWRVVDHDRDNERPADSRAEAEEMAETAREFGSDHVEIRAPHDNRATDGGSPDVVEAEPAADVDLPDALGETITEDPLDVLPSYMITHVDGDPTLNKRGVSVLAYHFGVSVEDKETVAYPHETDFEAAAVEITVTDEDGRTFVGAGESHVDETPKHQLLRMAETRAYKRAVIFATGTGIVGYQEIMAELTEGGQ